MWAREYNQHWRELVGDRDGQEEVSTVFAVSRFFISRRGVARCVGWDVCIVIVRKPVVANSYYFARKGAFLWDDYHSRACRMWIFTAGKICLWHKGKGENRLIYTDSVKIWGFRIRTTSHKSFQIKMLQTSHTELNQTWLCLPAGLIQSYLKLGRDSRKLGTPIRISSQPNWSLKC